MAEESDTRTANHEEIRIHLTNVLNFILRQLESENFDKNNIQYIYITCIYTVYIYIYIYIYIPYLSYIYIYIIVQSTDTCFAVPQLISVAWYNLDSWHGNYLYPSDCQWQPLVGQ